MATRSHSELLAPGWYRRDAATAARDLLGMRLHRGSVVLRITETEAYLGPADTACHTARGRTPRNAPMWGPGGHAYVYLCYGMHWMLNVVTGSGDGAAVLIRSAEVLQGLPVVLRRRGTGKGPTLVAGPGKVGQALDLDGSFSGHPLFEAGGLELLQGESVASVLCGARVGVDYSEPRDRDAPLRFADAESRAITRRKLLQPLQA